MTNMDKSSIDIYKIYFSMMLSDCKTKEEKQNNTVELIKIISNLTNLRFKECDFYIIIAHQKNKKVIE